MEQLIKHIARRKMAFASIMASAILTLVTSGTEHLGWLLMLTAMSMVFILWFLYEEGAVNRLKPNKNWIR